ncbi:flippase-like domain-containing protein [candidate division KSB1 bacterium]|nr:flippase-like domain-containing protein [candidate division KSB1 bacterium]
MLKSRLIFFGKLAVTAAVLFLLVHTIRPSTLVAAFDSANLAYLLMAATLLAPNLLVQLAKWRFLLKLANRSVSLGTAYRSLMVGFALGFVTPGRLGEVGRALYVKEISQTKTFALAVMDKLTNLIITLVVGLTGLLAFEALNLNPTLRASLIVTLTLLAGFILWSLLGRNVARASGRFTRIYDFSRKHLSILWGFSILFYTVYLTQFTLLLLNFQTASFADLPVAASSVFLVKTVLPISFGDLGIREGASVFFMQKVGVAPAAAFNAALLLYLLNVAFPSLVGLPILLRTRRSP